MTEARLPISAYVLAGGMSSRMGRDKALLPFQESSLIRRAAALLQKFTSDVQIVGPVERYCFLGLPVVPDSVPSKGPLSGICSALRKSQTEVNVFLACDMPAMRLEFIEHLLLEAPFSDVVIMRHQDGAIEPLCGVYNRSCLPAIEQSFSAGEYRVSAFFPHVRIKYISETVLRELGLTPDIFANVNTPADYERLCGALRNQFDHR